MLHVLKGSSSITVLCRIDPRLIEQLTIYIRAVYSYIYIYIYIHLWVTSLWSCWPNPNSFKRFWISSLLNFLSGIFPTSTAAATPTARLAHDQARLGNVSADIPSEIRWWVCEAYTAETNNQPQDWDVCFANWKTIQLPIKSYKCMHIPVSKTDVIWKGIYESQNTFKIMV